jgi:hypothetical protein
MPAARVRVAPPPPPLPEEGDGQSESERGRRESEPRHGTGGVYLFGTGAKWSIRKKEVNIRA